MNKARSIHRLSKKNFSLEESCTSAKWTFFLGHSLEYKYHKNLLNFSIKSFVNFNLFHEIWSSIKIPLFQKLAWTLDYYQCSTSPYKKCKTFLDLWQLKHALPKIHQLKSTHALNNGWFVVNCYTFPLRLIPRKACPLIGYTL